MSTLRVLPILFCFPLLLAAVDTDALFDGLIRQPPAQEAMLRRDLRPLAATEQAFAIALWHEQRQAPQLALAAVAKASPDDALVIASAALWAAESGQPAPARQQLARLDGLAPRGVTSAAGQVALAALHHAEGDAASAEAALRTAQAGLAAAVPEAAYETWRTRLVRQRCDRLRLQLDTARLGPELSALRSADRLMLDGRETEAIAAYADLRQRFPTGVCAATAGIAAARLSLLRGDAAPADALPKALAGQAPALLAQGLLVAGDAALALRADHAAALTAYRSALETLRNPDPPPTLAATQLAAATDTPAHHLNERRFPAWKPRQAGTLWIPSCSPWIDGHLRYLALTRMAVATWLGGRRDEAAQLAGSATVFDEVDRTMTPGAGSTVLASVLDDPGILLEVSEAATFPARQRPAVALAEMSYMLYDWRSCLAFLDLAERQGGRSAGKLPDRLLEFTRGRCHMMLWDWPRALTCFAAAAGKQPDDFWGKARMAEFSLVHQSDDDGPRRGDRILEEIQAALPGTSRARDALFAQAQLWCMRDPERSRRLFAKFSRLHPTWRPDVIAAQVADLPPAPAKATP